MSFKAELTVDSKTYKLRSVYTMIFRETDIKGRPTSPPSWAIIATIDAIDDTTITNWMIDPHKQVDGKVLIYKIDEDAKLKEITFKKSYCLHMNDKFMFDVSHSSCTIVISGSEIHIESSILIIA
jgi:hypothetical protein